jgi:pyruvate formate lyase activating enzyme
VQRKGRCLVAPLDTSGIVFDIQRFSIHDGPGIRTTIFFKGCSLHCFWCHNPESIHPKPELEVFPRRCIGCGACESVCPTGACRLVDGKLAFNAVLCNNCLDCVDTCFADGLVAGGYETTAQAVVDQVLWDRAFYANSGGGVTLSGGEPVLQTEFACAILEACHDAGIHTAIETAGNYPWKMVERLLPVLDLVIMDIKHWNAEQHRKATGVSNLRILDNAQRFAMTGKPILFCTPVIPTVNDSPDDIRAIARFVCSLINLRASGHISAPIEYALLTFHQMAGEKYISLGRDYRAHALKPLNKEQMSELNQILSDCMLQARDAVPMLKPDSGETYP